MNYGKVDNKIDRDEYYFTEALNTLTTNIAFAGPDNQVIMMTSTFPGEGKSTVSYELAVALAKMDKKVLFVDADLRKSTFIGRTEFSERVQGLSHFLSNQVPLKDTLVKTDIEGLTAIFAGPAPPNATHLLDSPRFKQLLKEAKNHYDYVIVDAPPLGAVVDGSIVANACDAAILLVQHGTIREKYVKNSIRQLEKSECPILGVIINKTPMKKNSYYKGYYKGYYRYE